jgi:hypothetical protein
MPHNAFIAETRTCETGVLIATAMRCRHRRCAHRHTTTIPTCSRMHNMWARSHDREDIDCCRRRVRVAVRHGKRQARFAGRSGPISKHRAMPAHDRSALARQRDCPGVAKSDLARGMRSSSRQREPCDEASVRPTCMSPFRPTLPRDANGATTQISELE